VSVQTVVFSVVTLWSFVSVYKCSRGTCCLHIQGQREYEEDMDQVILVLMWMVVTQNHGKGTWHRSLPGQYRWESRKVVITASAETCHIKKTCWLFCFWTYSPPFFKGVDERLPQSAQGEIVTLTLKMETASCSKIGIHQQDYMVLQHRRPQSENMFLFIHLSLPFTCKCVNIPNICIFWGHMIV
jgi:hypothetical protein